MAEKIKELRINLRAVFYRDGKYWIAHCLEMDVVGHGKEKKRAYTRMNEAIAEQIERSIRYNNRANIFQPADARIFEMFMAGRDAIKGLCIYVHKGDPAQVSAPMRKITRKETNRRGWFVSPHTPVVESREFEGQYAAAC